MDKYKPKRPTSLDLFPQLPPAGTQDSINNNSLGKKESWKENHSSSPHITGDRKSPDVKPKTEDKVRPNTRRLAPKPPTANDSSKSKNVGGASSAADSRLRPRDKNTHAAQTSNSPKTQRRTGGGAGRGRGGAVTKDRNAGVVKGKEGGAGATSKEEKKTGRLCSESRGKEKEKNFVQRNREGAAAKSRGVEGRGRGAARGGGAGGGGGGGGAANRGTNRVTNKVTSKSWSQQEVYLPAMVVPRTPVTVRRKEKNQVQEKVPAAKQDKNQENPPVLSRSSSEGGSNRMSLSSDTEGPPPGPLHPSVTHRTNPDITEEEVETELASAHNANNPVLTGSGQTDAVFTTSEAGLRVGGPSESGEVTAPSEAGLNYDSVKYTLVVDENAELELVSIKHCLHNDDSDGETVYQSANEEEDPEYQEERRKRSEEGESSTEKGDEEPTRKWKEEEVRRRREEEIKRRREVVARVCGKTRLTSTTGSSEEAGRGAGPRSRKFLNLFSSSSSSNSSRYTATGAGSFGVFSCVLDGVERQQTHRAAYRFVPRHADELQLETDDPVLLLSQAEDLWCQGYNMRTGATGIFPAFYVVKLAAEIAAAPTGGLLEQFLVRFLGSVQVPSHQGRDVLCAAMHKVVCNRRSANQPPSSCLLDISVRGVKINVQDQCRSPHRGDQCFHFFQLKNISFCGVHPKHSRYFGFITKHPDQQRFACHVMMSDTTLHPLAKSLGKAFQQYFKEHIGYSCPTEDIFIE